MYHSLFGACSHSIIGFISNDVCTSDMMCEFKNELNIYTKFLPLELFTRRVFLMCNRRTVKNIPKYAPAQFYIDNVLPRIKEKKIMSLKPFVDRLG